MKKSLIKQKQPASDETRLKRLRYRSWHRGCKETDVILGQFADERMSALEAPQLDIYERLLDEEDSDIWSWLTGKDTPSNPDYQALLTLLKAYKPA